MSAPLALQKYQDQVSHVLDVAWAGQTTDIDLEALFQYSDAFPAAERISVHHEKIKRQRTVLFQRGLPFLSRYLGKNRLEEELISPYFSHHTGHHWSPMKVFSDFYLYNWMRDVYKKEDQETVLLFLKSDLIWRKAITAPRLPCSTGSEGWILQPHVSLLHLRCNLFDVRQEALKNRSAPIPSLQKDREYFYIVFRNCFNNVVFEELDEGPFFLLSQMERERKSKSANSLLDLYVERGILA